MTIAFLKFYQYVVSPLIGPSCRFYPTCSHYAIEAFQNYGFFKGCYLTFGRVLRCHPGNPGGYDPVPGLGHQACQHRHVPMCSEHDQQKNH